MITFVIMFSCLTSYRNGRQGGQCYYELGQSPLEPRLVTVPGGPQTGREPHPKRQEGSRKESVSPDT